MIIDEIQKLIVEKQVLKERYRAFKILHEIIKKTTTLEELDLLQEAGKKILDPNITYE